MNKRAKKVGIWIRVSTDMQTETESPEVHRRRALAYAESKGWKVVEEYNLESMSGKSVGNLSETKRMLNDVRRGHIEALIFSKIARFARNTKELLEFAEIFEEYEADMISLGESIDTSTPAGRVVFTILSAFAQFEREEISERVAASVPIRAEMGKFLGGRAPFGYKVVDKELVIDEDEAPIRKRIYALYLQHKRKKTVASILSKEGYRTRAGKHFSASSITRILKDPIAKGVRIANHTTSRKGHKEAKPESEWIMQSVPAIITPEYWQEVQDLLKATANKPMKNRKIHLFTGIVECHCGGKMLVPSNSKKYVCKNKNCKHKIPQEDLEDIFKDQLHDLVLKDSTFEKLLQEGNKEQSQKEKLLASTQKEITLLKEKIDALIQLHINGQIPTEAFKEHHDEPYKQLQELKESEVTLQNELSLFNNDVKNLVDVIDIAKDVYGTWDSLEHTDKRSIIEMVAKKIIVDTDTIEIEVNPFTPFSETHNKWGTHGWL